MTIGYIGLGKMGASMVHRLLETGHKVVAYDPNAKARGSVSRSGARTAKSLEELVEQLEGRCTIWIMVPHQFVDDVLRDLTPLLKRGDVVIEGGNSPFKESMRRASELRERGIQMLDVGVSGGPSGARHGACMMIGGNKKIYKKYIKLFRDLNVKKGYAYMGPSGAGHFVKMVHNGIEYGMMQAIAEGFDIMDKSKDFNLNLEDIAKIYQHGSVIESRLMGWMQNAFAKYGGGLGPVSSKAHGLGEGAWTVEFAHKVKASDKVIHEALKARKRSQKKPSFQGKIIMALRNQFGGHPIDGK